jgi:hypothetical protein
MPHPISERTCEDSHLPGDEDAKLVRVLADGVLVLLLDGKKCEADLFGARLPQPPPERYFELLQERLARLRQPLRCARKGKSKGGRLQVSLWFYGWQDKSGDVWIELVPFLAEQGLLRGEGAKSKE